MKLDLNRQLYTNNYQESTKGFDKIQGGKDVRKKDKV